MPFTAIMNTPGYMPSSDDEPPIFEETPDAWGFLADERKRQEDDTDGDSYSSTYYTLSGFMHTGHDADVLYGDTPDYDGDHDLGVAYSVVQLETQATRCPCCGDDVIDVPGVACKDCRTAGCERTEDGCGESGYWGCQNTESIGYAETSGE